MSTSQSVIDESLVRLIDLDSVGQLVNKGKSEFNPLLPRSQFCADRRCLIDTFKEDQTHNSVVIALLLRYVNHYTMMKSFL